MVRKLFDMAREPALSIIFMDEIDSIGSVRNNDEVQPTLSVSFSNNLTLLCLSFSNYLISCKRKRMKLKRVLMATNRIGILDILLDVSGSDIRTIEIPLH